jgi:hypothetical protein
MYSLLRRKADRAGMIPLGLGGVRDLPSVIRQSTRTDELMPFVQELIEKQFLEVGDTHALIPEFIESETALASPAARKRKEREMRRDAASLMQKSRLDVTTARHARVTPRDTAPLSRQDVTIGRHDRTSQPVTHESRQVVTTGRHVDGHVSGHDGKSLSSFQIISDQIPPIPPHGGNGGNGGELDPIHGDPNLEDIRRKLASMGKPLCFLPAVRAEERLYAPVLSGGMTTQHVLQAIDDAAVSLGADLGAVQADDKPGLASLERFVAGCVKRARRDRHVVSTPVPTPRTQAQGTARPYEPGPEALDALDRFRELYTSTGGYDRYVVGPDDARLAGEAHAECEKHGDPHDILIRAIDAYMRDEFYASQGHNLKRFVAVLKTEPARLLGRRRAVESEEDKLEKWKHAQLMKDLREQMSS